MECRSTHARTHVHTHTLSCLVRRPVYEVAPMKDLPFNDATNLSKMITKPVAAPRPRPPNMMMRGKRNGVCKSMCVCVCVLCRITDDGDACRKGL
eukprot:1160333-Pelagomonas_calceolata.AAC.3